MFATLFVKVTGSIANPTVDHLFADFSLPAVPGASVMLIEEGKIVLSSSYGLADLETVTACSADTNYRLASVTKQFTAMCIMILAERGKLSLDDHLPKFSRHFPLMETTSPFAICLPIRPDCWIMKTLFLPPRQCR